MSLTVTSAARGPAKLWAIELGGKSRVPLRPSVFRNFASHGINAVVTTRSGWTPARHNQLLKLAKQTGLRIVELRSLPTKRARVLALQQACVGAVAGADSCAVVVPDAATAAAWIRRGTVRYVVLRVASPQAFTQASREANVADARDRDREAPDIRSGRCELGDCDRSRGDRRPGPCGDRGRRIIRSCAQFVSRDAQSGHHRVEATRGSACQPDTTPPSAPGNLTLLANGLDYITIGWADSTDDVAVTGYTYFLDGNSVGTTENDYVRIGALDCGTTYTVGVEAYDAAGNHSERASIQTGTVSGCRPYLGGGSAQAAAPTAPRPRERSASSRP